MSNKLDSAKTHVGVWLELPPGAHFAHEGLARLLYFITSELEESEMEITLITPFWLEEEVAEGIEGLSEEHQKRINYEVPKTRPSWALRKAVKFIEENKNKRTKRYRFVIRMIRRKRKLVKAIKRLFYTRKSLLEYVLLSPVLLALLPFVLLYGLLVRGGRAANRRFNGLLYDRLKFESIRLAAFHSGFKNEFKLIAKAINKTDLDCVLILNPFATQHARFVKKPIVSLFADYVQTACPSGFAEESIKLGRKNFRKLKDKIVHWITISEHVKHNQAINVFGIPENMLTTIYHGRVNVREYLPCEMDLFASTEESRQKASDRINLYCTNKLKFKYHKQSALERKSFVFLSKMPFNKVRYLLISTQNRPYKNTLRVIQAAAQLRERKQVEIKVIMTGAMPPEIAQYVDVKKLWLDVLVIPRVSNKIHACLYHCAELAVHASFFEGGIGAWPFDEAVSVGTPCLLTRNPATLELSDEPVFREQLADPYSVDDIAEKMQYVIENRQEVFEYQRSFYKNLADNRTWGDVGREYKAVFASAGKSGKAK